MKQLVNNSWRPLCRLKIFLLFLLLIASCTPKKSQQNNLISINTSLKEAKYYDLPIPIGFKQKKQSDSSEYTNNNIDLLVYEGNLNLLLTKDFYYKSLERVGWKIQDFSVSDEALFVCLKPSKKMVVSLRKLKKNNTVVYIFIENLNNSNKKIVDINSKDIRFLKDSFDQSLINQDLMKG